MSNSQLQKAIKRRSENLKEYLKQNKKITSEANKRFSDDRKQRQERGKDDAKQSQPTFLRPQDIERGLKYDVEKTFKTTLGGDLRYVTADDLKAFKGNIKTLADHYVGGITAKKIISLSSPIDIERCNTEILSVAPHSIKDGVVQFITNASGKYKEKVHYINVQFLEYNSMALSPDMPTSLQIKSRLSLGNVKFECDCGRHTYWYRYMASIGGYGYGRQEEGYPKVRNPRLMGLACKHVLRVMQYIQMPLFQNFIKNSISKERNTQLGKRIKPSVSEQVENIDSHSQKMKQSRTRTVKINPNLRDRELMRRATVQANKFNQRRVRNIAKEQNVTTQEAEHSLKVEARIQLLGLLKRGMITESAYKVLLKGIS